MSADNVRIWLPKQKNVLVVDKRLTVNLPWQHQLAVCSRCVELQPQRLGCWLLTVWLAVPRGSWLSTWQVVNVDQWTEVKWCIAVENFVFQDSQLVLNSSWNLQPVQTNESISNVATDPQAKISQATSFRTYWSQSVRWAGRPTRTPFP